MSLASFLSEPFANYIAKQTRQWSMNAVACQEKIFKSLIEVGKDTAFGRDHNFSSIQSYDAFKKQVPVRDYEALKSYIEKIKKGDENVLWKGKPIYLSKTSGTTSGVKY